MKSVLALSFVLSAVRAEELLGRGLDVVALDGSSFAPAPAPSPGPAPGPAASIAAVRLSFEIKNYNYLDFTKQTCPEPQEEASTGKKVAGKKKTAIARRHDIDLAHNIDKAFNRGINLPETDDLTGEIPEPEKIKVKTGTGAVDHINKVAAQDTENANRVLKGKAPKGGALPDVPDEAEEAVGQDAEEVEDVAEGKKPLKVDAALLQSGACVIQHSSLAAIHAKTDKCSTVMDVFRDAIKEVVGKVIKCSYNSMKTKGANIPPPMAPAPAFLQYRQPASPAPAAAGPVVPEAAIFVTFAPGREVGYGRSVIVEITLTDKPNGQDDVALVSTLLQQAKESGLLLKEIKAALEIVTGLMPKFGAVRLVSKAIDAWDVKKCEKHITKIVDDFSHAYAREHVPSALYNECTNFMTKLSFSHDHVLDPRDTDMCRKATVKFAKQWNYGKKATPKDFETMCVRSCEYKYGEKAPQCHIVAGDELAKQPK